MNQQAELIQSRITSGSIKVIADLRGDNITIGLARKIMDAAIHCMNDEDLEGITVITNGYNAQRDALMKSYDCHRYGGQHIHYRLVNPKYEDQCF